MKKLPKKTKILLAFLVLPALLGGVLLIKKAFFSRSVRLEELEEEVKSLREKKALLERDLKESKSREFVEKEARERLNMVYPGEIVVIFPKEGEDKEEETREEGFSLWRWLEEIF